MFGVSLPELVLIFVVILIVFGPEKLPEAARSFGKWMGELRRTSDGFRREFYNSVYTPANEIKREIQLAERNLHSAKEEAKKDIAEINPLKAEADSTNKQSESDDKKE